MLGLIAGEGAFPIEIARAARTRGIPVHAIGFPDVTHPDLEAGVTSIDWIPLGALRALLDSLHAAGATDLVLAGKVAKTHLHRPDVPVAPDALAYEFLSGLADRGDASVMGALATLLEREGFDLKPQTDWLPEWIAGAGVLTRTGPAPVQWADIHYGEPIARALTRVDVGQCIVVEGRTVLAVEAIEGTDAALRRAGSLGAGEGVVVKVAHPAQDLRFDCPAVGVRTLEVMCEAGLRTLAIETGRSVLIGGPEFLQRADELGISVVGVPAPGRADGMTADHGQGGNA